MNTKTMVVAGVVILGGCGSMPWSNRGPVEVKPGVMITAGEQQAISEQRLTSDFKRNGVKLIYTMTGELEAVESTGYAPVWGSSENARREATRMAELEAKKSMNDFINQETVSSSKSLAIISRNLEKAQDNKTNNFQTNRPTGITTSDEELDTDDAGKKPTDTRRVENTAQREDVMRIASTTRTDIRIQSKGILGGLQFKDGEIINDGRTVRVTYRWDRKNSAQRPLIRSLMVQ